MTKPIVPYWILALFALIVISTVTAVIRRRSQPSRVASKLYGLIVTQARSPALYAAGGIPDSQDGRFEAIALFTVLVLDRLLGEGPRGAALARALTETLISDMDDQMREMGVSDLKVPKHVKKAAAAVYDRLAAYQPHLASGDATALKGAFIASGLLQNPQLHNGNNSQPDLARHALAVRARLAAQPSQAVLDGSIDFPDYAAMIATGSRSEP